jgi:hypothetical protein
MRPLIVDRSKASSHPLSPGRFYSARVTNVYDNGKINIQVPELGTSYGPLFPIGATTPSQYAVNDIVICSFTNEFFTEMIVFGSARVKSSAGDQETRITTLEAQVETLSARIRALELGKWT